MSWASSSGACRRCLKFSYSGMSWYPALRHWAIVYAKTHKQKLLWKQWNNDLLWHFWHSNTISQLPNLCQEWQVLEGNKVELTRSVSKQRGTFRTPPIILPEEYHQSHLLSQTEGLVVPRNRGSLPCYSTAITWSSFSFPKTWQWKRLVGHCHGINPHFFFQ